MSNAQKASQVEGALSGIIVLPGLPRYRIKTVVQRGGRSAYYRLQYKYSYWPLWINGALSAYRSDAMSAILRDIAFRRGNMKNAVEDIDALELIANNPEVKEPHHPNMNPSKRLTNRP